MLLPKDPHLMTPAELADWTRALISRRAPESSSLDYKSALNVETRSDRVEFGKDVTSFVNEHGGVLLYGVPEIDQNGVPVPVPLTDCGLEAPPDFAEQLENILTDTVYPPLSELFVGLIQVPEIAPKVLFFVYHPESWNKPHRVEYRDARYYRRGNYRAIIMGAREIEAAYAARRSFAVAAREFMRTADFGDIPPGVPVMRVVLIPRFPLFRPEVMAERRFHL